MLRYRGQTGDFGSLDRSPTTIDPVMDSLGKHGCFLGRKRHFLGVTRLRRGAIRGVGAVDDDVGVHSLEAVSRIGQVFTVMAAPRVSRQASECCAKLFEDTVHELGPC